MFDLTFAARYVPVEVAGLAKLANEAEIVPVRVAGVKDKGTGV